jgi:hypothetical protein
MTRGPALRVARGLALLRGVADEIVVAVDDRVDPSLLAPLDEVADVLVRYPYLDPVDRPVGWLHSLCSGRWILNVDDDEIPSSALLELLPSLLADEAVTHFYVPRRWPFPDAESCLDEPPWHPDWQLRLVRNDTRLLWFPGVTHWPVQAVGPHRYLEAPLYHLDLLVNSREQRESKAAAYERALPGRRLAGLPMNLAVHVPEAVATLRTEPTPPVDVEAIRGVLAEPAWPEPAAGGTVPRTAERAAIDALFHGTEIDDSVYAAALEPLGYVAPFRAGETRQLAVRVENRGTQLWPWGGLGRPDIRVSYHWRDVAGRSLGGDGLRTAMPEPLAPGAATLVAVAVTAPPRPGRHALVLDLVHEHVRWFGCETVVDVDVLPMTRLAIVADEEAGLAPAAAVVTSELPSIAPVLFASDPQAVRERLGYETAPAARTSAPDRLGSLLRGAAIVKDARFPRSAAGDTPFLRELGRCGGLLVAGDRALRGRDGMRESWYQAVTLFAASSLGLPITVVATGRDQGSAARHPLAELALRRATVIRPRPGESLEDALVPAVRDLGRRVPV